MEKPRAPNLARTNYAVRSAAFLYCLLAIGLHLHEHGAPGSAWVLLVLQFAIYPHVLYLRALYSPKPTRAELDNLFLDSLLLGAWSAQLGFPVWIAFSLTGATLLNATVNRGARGALCSTACTLAGALVSIAIGELHFAPYTSPAVTGLAAAGSLFYTVAVGNVVFGKSRRLKAARNALRERESLYRLITEHAGDLIALLDPHGRWRYASPSHERLFEPAELRPGTDALARLHPDDAEHARAALARAAVTGKPRELALRLVDREGRMRQLRGRIQAVPGEAGLAEQLVLVSQDVTDLKESEERLLLAAHALEGMTEAILIASADGTIVTVNRAFCAITGFPREDVLGAHEKTVRNALQPPEFYDQIYTAVHLDGYWSGTTWCKRKNGSVYREWRSVRAIRNAAGAVTHYVMAFYEVGSAQPPSAAGLSST